MAPASIPPVILASITLFVGAFAFYVFARHRRNPLQLYFAVTCLLFGLYDVFCVFLYSAATVEQGLLWQRFQYATLALGGLAFLGFTHHYTGGLLSRWVVGPFAAACLTIATFGAFSDSDLVWKIDQPDIKTVILPGIGTVTYKEAAPGVLMDVQGLLAWLAFVYIGIVLWRFHKTDRQGRARPLLYAVACFGVGFLNDVMINWGIYRFLYLLEYSYMAVVLLMARAIATEFVQASRLREEQANLREQLRQAQKMEAIGRLAGGIAHDLNNMLTPIIGYVDMSRRRRRTAEELESYLERIGEAAEHSRRLTWQLLAFGRKQLLRVKVLGLNDVVAGAHGMLARLIPEDVRISVDLDPKVGMVLADETQLQQIVMNLALNARDAMPHGGEMILRTYNESVAAADPAEKTSIASGRYSVLEVTDTGCGMDEATRARVFEPFFTTKGPGCGTGLGLSTVYGIARQHEGFVRVVSEPGSGASFFVYLPSVESDAAPPTDPPAVVTAGAGELILLVEDQEMVRELVREALEGHGYRVIAAADPHEAMRILLEEGAEPRLLLTDVVMPGMNGPQLFERLVGHGRDIKVLFMSGYAGDVAVARGVTEDAVTILQKPFTVADLLAAVQGVLEPEAAGDPVGEA